MFRNKLNSHSEQSYRLPGGGSARRGGGRALRLVARIDPAGMDAAVERVGRLRIDRPLPDQATEGHLDVPGRAAEAVVEVEMPESGVQIVLPKQTYHPSPQPYALGIG